MACALLFILIIFTIIACICGIWCFKKPPKQSQNLPDQNQASRNQDSATTDSQQQIYTLQQQTSTMQQPRMGTYDRPREPDLLKERSQMPR